MGERDVTLILVTFVIILILMPFISAAPPPQKNVNINTGLEVEFTEIDFIENGQFHLFNAHVFNISTGLEVTNSTTTCKFSLFDNTGFHLINEVVMTYELDAEDWDYNVTGGNFTRNGIYSALIHCFTAEIGGFVSFNLEVTETGFEDKQPEIIYAVLLILMFLLDLLVIFIIIRLEVENPKDEKGNFIGITLKKYGRIVLIGISYGLILITLNLMNAAALNLSGATQFAGIIGGIFLAMLSVAWIWTLSIIIWIALVIWDDGKIVKEIRARLEEMENVV